MARLPAIVDVRAGQFARDYLAGGATLAELAARYGMGISTVKRLRAAMGLTPRKKHYVPSKLRPVRRAVGTVDRPCRRARADRACEALLKALRKHHPLAPPRAARDVPVGASWAFTDHRTCAEWV